VGSGSILLPAGMDDPDSVDLALDLLVFLVFLKERTIAGSNNRPVVSVCLSCFVYAFRGFLEPGGYGSRDGVLEDRVLGQA
jgi:hypothetical protein